MTRTTIVAALAALGALVATLTASATTTQGLVAELQTTSPALQLSTSAAKESSITSARSRPHSHSPGSDRGPATAPA